MNFEKYDAMMDGIETLEFDGDLEETKQNFAINSPDLADWAIRKIKERRAEAERLTSICDNLILEYDEKKRQIAADLDRNTSFLLHCLEEYFGTVEHKETKTQESFKLVSGSLVYKKPSADYDRDDEKLTKWLEDNGRKEFVEYKAKTKWADLKKQIVIVGDEVVMADTGEVIEGLKPTEKEGKFDVK